MLSGTDDSETLRADLLKAIRDKWQEGQSFAASHGANGLHARRTLNCPRRSTKRRAHGLKSITGKLLADGSIRAIGLQRWQPPVPARRNRRRTETRARSE
jgi:hypothetical protein